jgi:3D (Asp-Asp-Asp) domain-containing protein
VTAKPPAPIALPSLTRAITPRLPHVRSLFVRAVPGERVRVTVTWYCLRGRTRLGTPVREGIVAADPRVFPLAQHIELHVGGKSYGTFRVDDTGKKIKGPRIDVWTPNCKEALRYGVQRGHATLLARAGS